MSEQSSRLLTYNRYAIVLGSRYQELSKILKTGFETPLQETVTYISGHFKNSILYRNMYNINTCTMISFKLMGSIFWDHGVVFLLIHRDVILWIHQFQ